MATTDPNPIPFSQGTFPGVNPQEGSGRLVNVYAEPLGDPQNPTGPARMVLRRACGLSQFAMTAQSGYRGGLLVNNLSYEAWANEAATIDGGGNVTLLGAFPGTKSISIARNQATNPDVVAVDPDNGAYILETTALTNATATATVAGSAFNSGDIVVLDFDNTDIQGFPVSITYTLGGGESATTIATGLTSLINGNATLAAANVSATSALGVVTVSQQGAIGNDTTLVAFISGTGNETVTFNPAGGNLAGGAGTPGIVFTGAPLAYNALGILPAPNSVSFQDGYFFFTTGAGFVYATGINSLSMNALTFVKIQAKSDVTLLRGIPYAGVMLFFTTGSCEIWQDAANPAPNFPYARVLVLEQGLIQQGAIAGFETGFSDLLWVSPDFKVQRLPAQALQPPTPVSSPDLEKLIEKAFRAGDTLTAGTYEVAGKKYWHLSSSTWSWEFNLTHGKWNERQSLLSSGIYGRWRGTIGHPAFGKWLLGDQQSGNLLFADDQNYTENGMPLLFRVESGPIKNFPGYIRIARADFDFDMGVGIAVGNVLMNISGAVAGTGGVVRLTVNNTAQTSNNDTVIVVGVTGTTEANGTWQMTLIDATHIELQASVFVNAYISGGTATDVTSPPQAINPTVAISCSKDGGQSWGNPLLRSLGPQGKIKRTRASVKNMGMSGPMGDRWRLDVTDPCYVALLGGTQSSNPREIGA
jgi:hypothetical protein